jgi:hypothetical protein
MTDWQRVVAYFQDHPGSSRGEAQQALGWIHVTARMSDARLRGVEFDKQRDDKGVWRFWVVEPRPKATTGVQEAMAL